MERESQDSGCASLEGLRIYDVPGFCPDRYPDDAEHTIQQILHEAKPTYVVYVAESELKTNFGVLLGELAHTLEEVVVVVHRVMTLFNSHTYQFCKDAEDIYELFYLLHHSQQISMLHTHLLEVITERFKLEECQRALKNYHETQLVPYVESCVDHTFVQTIDQNRSGNNKRAVAYNLGEEWNKLDETNSRQAKKKIAMLLGKDPAEIYIHGGGRTGDEANNPQATKKTFCRKDAKDVYIHVTGRETSNCDRHTNNSKIYQPVQEAQYWQGASMCHGVQAKHIS